MVGAIDEISLDDTPDRLPTTFDLDLVQWRPVDEDIIRTQWIGPNLSPDQEPIGPDIDDPFDYNCFADVTVVCETYLTGVNEMQVISVRSLQPDVHDGAGSYRLTFNGESTPLIPVTDVFPATIKFQLEQLASVGLDLSLIHI